VKLTVIKQNEYDYISARELKNSLDISEKHKICTLDKKTNQKGLFRNR